MFQIIYVQIIKFVDYPYALVRHVPNPALIKTLSTFICLPTHDSTAAKISTKYDNEKFYKKVSGHFNFYLLVH
jgi:hypothetical protein